MVHPCNVPLPPPRACWFLWSHRFLLRFMMFRCVWRYFLPACQCSRTRQSAAAAAAAAVRRLQALQPPPPVPKNVSSVSLALSAMGTRLLRQIAPLFKELSIPFTLN